VKCYIRGTTSASLSIQGDPDAIVSNYARTIKDAVLNITEAVAKTIPGALADAAEDLLSGDLGSVFDLDDSNDDPFPVMQVDLDLKLPPLSTVTARFAFDEDLEVYMMLNTKLALGGTYTINLFSSAGPFGIAVGNDITAGLAVVLDLILDVQAPVEINGGFHLKLNKGVAMELNMFSPNVSDLRL
jgi:hypothetical protein